MSTNLLTAKKKAIKSIIDIICKIRSNLIHLDQVQNKISKVITTLNKDLLKEGKLNKSGEIIDPYETNSSKDIESNLIQKIIDIARI